MQPSEYTLDEAYESKNVILSASMDAEFKREIEDRIFLGEMYGNEFKYSAVLKNEINEEWKRLFNSKKRILGVLARGTDYTYLKPKGHPIPCDTSKYIKYVKEYMIQYKYEYIYLATEDLDIYNQFMGEFPKAVLLSSNQKRISKKGNETELMDIKFYNERDGYFRGMEYNVVISMLAMCDGLIANCMCGGVSGAILQNAGKYDYIKIIEAGIYN